MLILSRGANPISMARRWITITLAMVVAAGVASWLAFRKPAYNLEPRTYEELAETLARMILQGDYALVEKVSHLDGVPEGIRRKNAEAFRFGKEISESLGAFSEKLILDFLPGAETGIGTEEHWPIYNVDPEKVIVLIGKAKGGFDLRFSFAAAKVGDVAQVWGASEMLENPTVLGVERRVVEAPSAPDLIPKPGEGISIARTPEGATSSSISFHPGFQAKNESLDSILWEIDTECDYYYSEVIFPNETFDISLDPDVKVAESGLASAVEGLLETRYGVEVDRVDLDIPCYVMKALPERGVGLREGAGSGLRHDGRSFKSMPLARFCEELSRQLPFIVLDETGLDGAYDFEYNAFEKNASVANHRLADLGLALEYANRRVKTLRFRQKLSP